MASHCRSNALSERSESKGFPQHIQVECPALGGARGSLSEVEGSERSESKGNPQHLTSNALSPSAALGAPWTKSKGASGAKPAFIFAADDAIVVCVWYLYILRCSNGSLYIGETGNVANRVAEHNRGVWLDVHGPVSSG